jgi:hypothetical protein
MKHPLNLNEALAAHLDWKVRLLAAIQLEERVDSDIVGTDLGCILGHWLHGTGKRAYGDRPEFHAVVAAHAAFHKEAHHVAAAIHAGAFNRAHDLLHDDGPYARASDLIARTFAALRVSVGEPDLKAEEVEGLSAQSAS